MVIQGTFFIGLLKSSVLGTASRTATFDFRRIVLLYMLEDTSISFLYFLKGKPSNNFHIHCQEAVLLIAEI